MTRSCPLCGSMRIGESPVVSPPRRVAESLQFGELRDYWRGFRSDATFFTYARCESCSFVYAPNYFTEEQLTELYGFMPNNTNNESMHPLRETQRGYQREIREYGFRGAQILDIGADIGLLVEAFRQIATSVVVDAIEPNVGVHKDLQAAVGAQGRVVGSWKDLPGDARYDLIAGIHVLDHIVNLKAAIGEVTSRIRPGGQIYFVTHNERSLMRRLLGRRWPPFCLQHPHLFDHRTLAKLFEDSGFVDVKVRRTTNYFSLPHIVQVATELLGLPKRIVAFVPPVVLPLKLGNISVQGKWPD